MEHCGHGSYTMDLTFGVMHCIVAASHTRQREGVLAAQHTGIVWYGGWVQTTVPIPVADRSTVLPQRH